MTQEPVFSRTATSWFLSGFVLSILICASINALSYFVRSDGWGNLLGTRAGRVEALGFPVQVWEKGNTYGGYFADYRALALNAAFAAGLGIVLGLLAAKQRDWLNRLVALIEETLSDQQDNFQFSLRGLLIVTALAALGAALARQVLAARPEALGAIYAVGPWVLVVIALLPRGIPWQQRVWILTPITLASMLVAILIGASLDPPLEFDEVLLGIFVCWTPQTALAAVGLIAWILFDGRRQMSQAGAE